MGQMTETRRKFRLKNSGNWVVILLLATVWQIFDMKSIQSPETEILSIYWEFLDKVREPATSELILWRILTIWNHCGGLGRCADKHPLADTERVNKEGFFDAHGFLKAESKKGNTETPLIGRFFGPRKIVLIENRPIRGVFMV